MLQLILGVKILNSQGRKILKPHPCKFRAAQLPTLHWEGGIQYLQVVSFCTLCLMVWNVFFTWCAVMRM